MERRLFRLVMIAILLVVGSSLTWSQAQIPFKANNTWGYFDENRTVVHLVGDGNPWRIINKTQTFISPELRLIEARNFSDGLSLVYGDSPTTKKRGSGYLVSDFVFQEADTLQDGYARIIKNGRDGQMDKTGKVYWCGEVVGLKK